MKTLLFTIAALLLFTGCNNTKEYARNFSEADLVVNDGFRATEQVARAYLIYWDYGLEEAKSEVLKSGISDAAEGAWAKAVQAIQKVKSPPPSYQCAHAKLVEAFGIYEAFFFHVTFPSGQKENYAAVVSDETSKFHSAEGEVFALTPK